MLFCYMSFGWKSRHLKMKWIRCFRTEGLKNDWVLNDDENEFFRRRTQIRERGATAVSITELSMPTKCETQHNDTWNWVSLGWLSFMLSVKINFIMLSVGMPSVVMLSVVAPWKADVQIGCERLEIARIERR
jgi:hypothetical protein